MHGMDATEWIALVMAEDGPGTFVMEGRDGWLIVWRVTGDEPEDMAYSISPDELVQDAVRPAAPRP